MTAHRVKGTVAGVDEAGRGPLAGPVIAAAVVLPEKLARSRRLKGLTDCKLLTAERRQAFHEILIAEAEVAVGRAEPEEIDRLNILQASLLAMSRAVAGLSAAPAAALVDGNRPPMLACETQCVVGGDGRSLCIAAASVVAKVVRDREMERLALTHPGYGWERNRGYGTAEHREAILRLGITPQHRRSFAPVREALALTA